MPKTLVPLCLILLANTDLVEWEMNSASYGNHVTDGGHGSRERRRIGPTSLLQGSFHTRTCSLTQIGSGEWEGQLAGTETCSLSWFLVLSEWYVHVFIWDSRKIRKVPIGSASTVACCGEYVRPRHGCLALSTAEEGELQTVLASRRDHSSWKGRVRPAEGQGH